MCGTGLAQGAGQPPEFLTQRGQDFHSPHGGLDVEPQLLEGQESLALKVLQLGDQDHVLLDEGPCGGSQGMVHLPILKRRLLFYEPVKKQIRKHLCGSQEKGQCRNITAGQETA